MSKLKFDFTDENYLITGASSGMGRQIAKDLALAGARVLAIGRRKENLMEMAGECPANSIVPLVSSLEDRERISAGMAEFIAKRGKFHGMVHAAGICDYTPIRKYNEKTAHEIMETSFWQGMNLVQQLQKKRNAHDGSSFVLFASVAGIGGKRGLFAYAAAKAAVINAVKSISGELAVRGIRINAICPGRVATQMTADMPEENFIDRHVLGEGQVENVVGAVLFLLSDEGKWITGSSLTVDGGYLAN